MSAQSPEVVILHDLAHGNPSPVLRALDLELPFFVASYTDLGEHNPHNERLGADIAGCDVLLVQVDLLEPTVTQAAQVALSGFFDGTNKDMSIFAFDGNYQVRQLHSSETKEA